MPTLGLIGIVVVVLLVLGALVPRALAAQPPPKDPTPAAAPDKAPEKAAAPKLTAAQLQERLGKLAKEAPPTDLAPAAMCYEMAAQAKTADYVCPVDGSRTQYPRDSGMVEFVESLPSMRATAKELPGVDASLDERAMCRKCEPKGSGGVALVIKYPDGRTVRTEGVNGTDLLLLREFLSGSLKHAGSYGAEQPLKDSLPRIRALLGLAEK